MRLTRDSECNSLLMLPFQPCCQQIFGLNVIDPAVNDLDKEVFYNCIHRAVVAPCLNNTLTPTALSNLELSKHLFTFEDAAGHMKQNGPIMLYLVLLKVDLQHLLALRTIAKQLRQRQCRNIKLMFWHSSHSSKLTTNKWLQTVDCTKRKHFVAILLLLLVLDQMRISSSLLKALIAMFTPELALMQTLKPRTSSLQPNNTTTMKYLKELGCQLIQKMQGFWPLLLRSSNSRNPPHTKNRQIKLPLLLELDLLWETWTSSLVLRYGAPRTNESQSLAMEWPIIGVPVTSTRLVTTAVFVTKTMVPQPMMSGRKLVIGTQRKVKGRKPCCYWWWRERETYYCEQIKDCTCFQPLRFWRGSQ